jgi:hypothetical protein
MENSDPEKKITVDKILFEKIQKSVVSIQRATIDKILQILRPQPIPFFENTVSNFSVENFQFMFFNLHPPKG